MNLTTTLCISDAQKKQFHEKGYFLLDRVISEAHIELLRTE